MTAKPSPIGDLEFGTIALCIRDHTLFSAPEIEEYRSLLSAAELARNNSFRQRTHRRRDIACRGLLRRQLSHFLDTPAEEFQFIVNENGKPRLAGPHSNLHFNCSHSGNYVALAYCSGIEVGVDIEDTTRRNNLLGIAEHFFAPEEAQALIALPLEQQRARFFQYWTLKEAYLKARGEGIFLGLDKFIFEFGSDDDGDDNLEIGIRFPSESFDQAHHWQFQSLSPLPECRVGVAVRTGAPAFPIKRFS